jgi:hypothetical protein
MLTRLLRNVTETVLCWRGFCGMLQKLCYVDDAFAECYRNCVMLTRLCGMLQKLCCVDEAFAECYRNCVVLTRLLRNVTETVLCWRGFAECYRNWRGGYVQARWTVTLSSTCAVKPAYPVTLPWCCTTVTTDITKETRFRANRQSTSSPTQSGHCHRPNTLSCPMMNFRFILW